MKVGIFARCDDTGLGIQSREFFNHVKCKALVIDSTNFKNLPQHFEWYPRQTVFKPERTLMIPENVIMDFVMGLDVLVTFETPYDYKVFDICRKYEVKTILQPNYEFLEYPSDKPLPDLFAAPSTWHFDNIPNPKVLLPVPVNTSLFTFEPKFKTFVHVVGKPAVFDRNGTDLFLASLKYVKKPISVIVHSTHRLTIPQIPPYVNFYVDSRPKPNYWENFTGGVLVMPRKYGGLSLTVNEALGAEMPVIMSNISPNKDWLPPEWLVNVRQKGSFMCKQKIDIWETDPQLLAYKIEEFCDERFYLTAVEKAMELKQQLSWDNLLPLYKKTFKNLTGILPSDR